MGLDILYLLITASVLLALVALALFIWATHSGQFDDLETPAIRILFDDPSPGAEHARDVTGDLRPARGAAQPRTSAGTPE
jgi:cbb3-type cytochrome oxidase maturation protein